MRAAIIARALAVALIVAACSPAAPPEPPALPQSTAVYTGLGRETLGAHRSVFDIRFDGAFGWSYHLETRTDGEATEYLLHIDGVSPAHNPGDVRLVTRGGVSRMRGPGTNDECLQFPSDLDLGPVFMTPDDLIDPPRLSEALTGTSPTASDGDWLAEYSLRPDSLGQWRDPRIDLSRNEASGSVLRYGLQASGPDPLFDAGEGSLTAEFSVTEIGAQTIDPVAGCEIDLPLPGDATRLVKLPGLIAFESTMPSNEIAAFYQSALPAAGWESVVEPQVGGEAIVLSFGRGGQTLDISILAKDGTQLVELWLGD